MAATSQMQEPFRYPRRRWPQKAGLRCLICLIIWWHCYSYFVIFQGIDLQQERTSTSSLLDVPVVKSGNAITEPRNRDRAATNEGAHEEEMSEGSTAPVNIHKHYPLTCGAHVNISSLHPASFGLFEMAYGYTPNSTNTRGHSDYQGPMERGVELVTELQMCLYNALDRWILLANEYNMTRWSAHGGSAMAAVCHRSINPWDDDIDITVSTCQHLKDIFAQGGNIAERYPEMNKGQYSYQRTWEGRLLDDDWMILKASRGPKWFKLKSVTQALSLPVTSDLSGLDIMCFDAGISQPELSPMKLSGFRKYCKSSCFWLHYSSHMMCCVSCISLASHLLRWAICLQYKEKKLYRKCSLDHPICN